MIRIAALNDSDSWDENTTTSQHAATTKEAKEAEAFSLYSHALSLQREGDVLGAEETFKDLISHEFLLEAARLVDEEIDNVVHPGLQLLYSIYKNMAAISAERGDLQAAMKSYLEAVKIDWSEVTVWYKIGTIGLKIYDFSLSRLAFEQGLQCNPNHWPCLDNLITLSYALNDYLRCLYYISKALEKDGCYEKGIALREEMFREQPSLRDDTRDLFAHCDPEVLTTKLDKDDAEEYVEEALSIRRKKQELSRRPPPRVIKFPEKIKSNTWKAVGEALITLYNHAMHSSPCLSLSRKVDMSEYESGIIPETPEPMDSADIKPSESSTDPKQSDSTNTKSNTVDPKSSKTDDTKNLENSGADVSQNSNSVVKIESKPAESAEQIKDTESVVPQVCANVNLAKTIKSATPQDCAQPTSDGSILQEGTQSETKMETEDVVDGDVKTGQEEDKSKKTDSKVPPPSGTQQVIVIPEEVLDETVNEPVKVKPESMDFETKDITCLAQEAITTPCKPELPREETGVDVEMKTEVEDAGEDDLDEYSISTGLDMSPGPAEPPQLEVQTPLQPTLPLQSEGSELKSDPPVLSLPQAPLPTTISPGAPVPTATDNLVKQSTAVPTGTDNLVKPSTAVPTATDSLVKPSTAVTTAIDILVKPAAAVSSTADGQVTPAAPVMRGMLGLPQPASIAGSPQVTLAPSTAAHPLIAAQLISTPKSSLLLSTAMPPATSALQITVPSQGIKMQSPPLTPRLLSPVHGLTSPRYHSAPNTPDIQTANLFMRSPPAVQVDTPKSQSLLSIALTNPHLSSLPFSTQIGGGDAATNPQISPTHRSLLSPTMQGQPTSMTSYAQSVPLQSTLSKHLSPVQGLMVTPASSQSALSKQLSPEEKQTIAQHAAAQTLIALAQRPTKLSPPIQSPPGGIITTSNTLTSLMSGGVMKQSSNTGMSAVPFPLPAEVALQDHPRTLPRELIRGHGGRRGTKRKRGGGLHLEGAGMKRRSARVRNTSRRKQEDSINMQELLYKFLPSSLTQVSDDDEDMMRMDESDVSTSVLETTANKSTVSGAPSEASLKSTEQEDVKEFVRTCLKNYGIMDLMFRFLSTLADKSSLKWPEDLAGVYVEVYDKLRQHIRLPSVIGADDGMTEEDIREHGRITLLWGELKLDHWLSTHSKASGTPHRGGMHAILGAAREGEDYQTEDLWYLMTLAGCRHFMLDSWLQFAARVYWFKARLSMIQSDKREADYCFDKLSYVMDCAKEEKDISCFKLQNCKVDDIISKEQVDLQQESLQRSQSLEETQKLYEAGNYDRVVELLLQTFTQPHTAKKISEMGGSLPERHSQLMLLQDSLYRLKDYKKCLLWGEVSFNESLQKYRRAEGQNRDDWLSTIKQIFQHVNKVLDKDDSILKSLPSSNTVRLSQNLIRMIELAMDSPDSSSEVSDTVVLSWILLSRLIKSEESKLRSMLVEGEGQEGVGIDGAISSSLMLLNVAHEYLGRQSWCTKSQGALLLYFLGELEAEMKKPHFVREGLDMALEQCVYCLYGHPNKKGKAKHLQDHNAPVIELDWERSGIVFDYFKPKTVPEFDSYKADTVSTERETLLRRLIALVPADIGPGKYTESVQSYIDGETSTAPSVQTQSPILMDLYYLLADYYFKNKETNKAIKFYKQDICMNPLRLDSWAGLALARMSQLEQKLSSMELKMDVPLHKKAIAALRCFKRAVEIDETQRKLWTEYGSLAYQLHSHASRQLKMQDWFPLNSELLGITTDTKHEMLQTAQNCYWKASECEADGSEEEWLHHYMMGKVKEKKRCHPRDFLEHYRQAAIYLHEDGAFYPKKIIYAGSSPPRLAIEALEVFYRLHVAILKQLLKKGGEMVDYDLFQQYLTEAADSPFAQGKEKKHERRESQSASLDESSSSIPTPLAYSQLKARPVYHMTPQDHNYSKQKSSVDGSDSCDTAKDSQSNHSHPKCSKETDRKDKGETVKSDSEKSDKNSQSESDKNNRSESDKESQSEAEKSNKTEVMKISSDNPVSLQKISSTGFTPKLDPAAESDVENKPVVVETDKPKIAVEKPESLIESKVKPGTDSVGKIGAEKETDEPTKPTEGKPEDESNKACSDDNEMVLDPATGLMVTVPKTEEDKMDIDEIVLIEDSPSSLKNEPLKMEEDKTVTSLPSSKDSEKDVDIIEISDDESQSPVKNPLRLSLKKPEIKQTPVERSNTPNSRKELFKSETTTKDTDHAKATMDSNQVKPIIDSSEAKPNKESEQTKPTTDTEQTKPTTDTEQTKPTTDTEQTKPTKDTNLADPIKDTDPTKQTKDTEQAKATKDAPCEEKERIDSVSGSSASDSSSESESDMDQHDSMDREILHTELLDKCIDALHLCVQRFPTHYKSVYRLAHVYMTSPYHKNLECARDLLLGNPNWQNLSHMRGPGLFAERKANNFFQGIWKIPIEEIDRSGSFSSHILRSVRLLLDVLKEQRDVGMLLQVHKWLNRSPDSGKKYIRDPERKILAKSSFKFILEAIQQELQHWDRKKPRNKQIDFLHSVYKAYQHANLKLNAFVDNMKDLLIKVFKLVQRDSLEPGVPLFEQATRFCQQRSSLQSTDTNRSSNTSGFMSPPSSKAPAPAADPNTSVDNVFISPKPSNPILLSPPHKVSPNPAILSPSPKKNIQSPFSSPTSRISNQSEAGIAQTGQSEGSKYSSQSEVSSASQSEGDDALVFTNPGSLTSAVQPQLLSVGVQGSFCLQDNPGFYPIQHKLPVMNYPDPSTNVRHLSGHLTTSLAHTALTASWCRLPDQTPLPASPHLTSSPYVCSQDQTLKMKPKHPIASSINLKTVADGMKKRLRTALLSSPQLLTSSKCATVGADKPSDDKLAPSASISLPSSRLPQDKVATTVLKRPIANYIMPQHSKPLSLPSGSFIQSTRTHQDIISASVLQSLQGSCNSEDLIPAPPVYGELKDKTFSKHANLDVRKPTLMSLLHQNTDIFKSGERKPVRTVLADVLDAQSSPFKQSILKSELLTSPDKSLGSNPSQSTKGNSHESSLTHNITFEKKDETPTRKAKTKEVDLEDMIPTLQVRIPSAEGPYLLDRQEYSLSIPSPPESREASSSGKEDTQHKAAQIRNEVILSDDKTKEGFSLQSFSKDDVYEFIDEEESVSLGGYRKHHPFPVAETLRKEYQRGISLDTGISSLTKTSDWRPPKLGLSPELVASSSIRNTPLDSFPSSSTTKTNVDTDDTKCSVQDSRSSVTSSVPYDIHNIFSVTDSPVSNQQKSETPSKFTETSAQTIKIGTTIEPTFSVGPKLAAPLEFGVLSSEQDTKGGKSVMPEISIVPMDITPSVPPAPLTLGCYNTDLYEFISDDSDEHELTIDFG